MNWENTFKIGVLVCLMALPFFWLGLKVGLSLGYGSDEAHDETLDMMVDCAESLNVCDEDRARLAITCVNVCSRCDFDDEILEP